MAGSAGLKTYTEVLLRDFSGGLNLRDALTELAPNESPDCINVILDERGGMAKRLGYVKWNATAVANPITYGYESHVAGRILWYSVADGNCYYEASEGVLAVGRTFAAGGRVAIVDFAGKVYLIHHLDGLFESADGIAWTPVIPTSGQWGTVTSATGSPGLTIPVSADSDWDNLKTGTVVDIFIRATGVNPGNGFKREIASVSRAAGTITIDTAAFSTDANSGDVTFDNTCGVYMSGAYTHIPFGDQLATWQNKLWLASSTTNLLSFSAPGDATKWNSADDAGANHVREGNDFPIVCIYGTSGIDVQAQPSLLVGKRSGAHGSLHRVTDAATGDYVTIDQAVGPTGPAGITSLYGRVYLLSTAGVFASDGHSPLQPIGEKLNRLFRPTALEFSLASGWVAEATNERIRFSVAQKNATYNDLCLEYHPFFGAFTARSDASSWYVRHAGDLLGVSPSVTGRVYKLDSGGSDDGAAIDAHALTRVIVPSLGYEARLQHVVITGRGDYTLKVLPDFSTDGAEHAVSISGDGFHWDVDAWDDPDAGGWGEETVEGTDDTFWPRLLARQFQIRLDESSTITRIAPALLGEGAQPTIGAFALIGLRLDFSVLAPS